jgi:hypothetical protein
MQQKYRERKEWLFLLGVTVAHGEGDFETGVAIASLGRSAYRASTTAIALKNTKIMLRPP